MPCRPVCVPFRSPQLANGWYCPVCEEPFAAPPVLLAPTTHAPIRGLRTYKVRGLLKKLGGRWEPTGKTWWVPVDQLNVATHTVKHLEDPPDAPDTSPGASEPWLCWECGEQLPAPALARMLREATAERPDDYWCGCSDD